MAEKGPLDAISDRSTERWTQSTMYLNAFAESALSSSFFTRPVAEFVRTRKDKTADEKHLTAKA